MLGAAERIVRTQLVLLAAAGVEAAVDAYLLQQSGVVVAHSALLLGALPLAWGVASLLAAPVALGAAALQRSTESRRRTFAVSVVLGLVAGAVALVTTTGGHFSNRVLRAALVAATGAIGAVGYFYCAPVAARLASRSPGLARLGVALLVCAAWAADATLLPGLYPALHTALFGVVLFGLGLLGAVLEIPRGRRALAGVVLLGLGPACVALPSAKEDGHVILALQDRAPLLGRLTTAAVLMVPTRVAAAAGGALPLPGAVPQTLDWTGRDILLVTIDALRADHVSALGYARRTTPVLDALAAKGVLFEQAYGIPRTSFAMASLMTGRTAALVRPWAPRQDTCIAEHLGRVGYRTGAFYPDSVFAFPRGLFTVYEDSHLGFSERVGGKTNELLAATRAWLEVEDSRPVFLWFHIIEPHGPYVYRPRFAFGPAEGASAMDLYDGGIAEADSVLGDLLAMIEKRGRSPVILAVADHGEAFGEHGVSYHGRVAYEEMVHVPLVVHGRGIAPARIGTVVQISDIAPTIMSALAIPRPTHCTGRDLGSIFAGGHRSTVDDPGLAITTAEHHYLVASGPDRLLCSANLGACALYDLRDDPLQRRDVSEARRERAAVLRATLDKAMPSLRR